MSANDRQTENKQKQSQSHWSAWQILGDNAANQIPAVFIARRWRVCQIQCGTQTIEQMLQIACMSKIGLK